MYATAFKQNEMPYNLPMRFVSIHIQILMKPQNLQKKTPHITSFPLTNIMQIFRTECNKMIMNRALAKHCQAFRQWNT